MAAGVLKTLVGSDWERALLVCSRCSRKLGGGYGPKGRTPLAKLLRTLPGFGKRRRARVGVLEVKCLGVCPKRAVTVVDSADPARWRLIPPGLEAEEAARLALGGTVGPMPVITIETTELVETVVVTGVA